MPIFDESTLRKLEQLTLVADRVRVGVMKGDRRSSKRGTSIEFADYRNYTKGDDLRRLDWNVYARLERPFIKLLEEEEDLAVHLVIDGSASMNWPDDEEENKLRYALKLAAALGHIALATGDLVKVSVIGEQERRWGPYRGQQNTLQLLQYLESVSASGRTDLNISLRDYAMRGGRPGLLMLFTDLMTPSGYQLGLNALQSRGYEVGIFHILSLDEVDPVATGDLKLIDVETGTEAEITLDATTLQEYRARVESWRNEIGSYCNGRLIHYIPLTTTDAWDKLIMQTLRQKNLVK